MVLVPTCFVHCWFSFCLPCSMACKTWWWNVLHSIQNVWLIQPCQSASTAQLLLSSDPWKWTSHQNSLAIIGFLWWRYCGHKHCALVGKNIERLWQKCGLKCPATFWKACHSNLLCEKAKVEHIKKKKSKNFSESHSAKAEHWFSPYQWKY